MQKTSLGNRKKIFFSLLAVFAAIFSLVIGTGVWAAQTTINVTDGSVSDWKGVAAFNDSYGDVSGVGPNDIVKLWVTSDSTNIYCRWDVILSGSKAKVTSAAYSLSLSSVAASGVTRPAVEVKAYVAFNSQGSVSSVAIENATKKISLPITYAEQISTGVTKTLVSVEAKFPFSSFNDNAMTVNRLGTADLFPLWGEALSSGSFNSAVKDIVPDMGYLKYDAINSVSTPVGTGPVANIAIAAINDNVVPGALVDYVVTIKNVGDSTGNPNLLFNSINWTLPTGFTYVSGSSTGLTTSNPTISSGTLTWAVPGGSLAPGASTNIHFKATASSTSGSYYSNSTVVATTPNISYQTGDGAVVNVDPKYIVPNTPLNLIASNTTQTTTTLTWSSALNAVAYDIYDNNVEIVTNTPYTTYTLTGLEPGSTYYYTVRGKSLIDVESNSSNSVTVTTVSPYTVAINNIITKNTKPTVTGTTTAPNGSTISLVLNGNTYTGTVSGGIWSIAVTDALADNTYIASASVLNAVGNTATGTVTVDTVAPSITVTSFDTSDTMPSLRGTTDAADGSVVTVTINSVNYNCVAADNIWSVNITNSLAVASYTVTANVTDAAGNTGTGSGTVQITAIPQSPNNNLSNLTTTAGEISPAFSSSVTSYTANVSCGVSSITITPTVEDIKSIVRVEGVIVPSGSASDSISLNEGVNNLIIRVAAEDSSIKFYYLTVNRAYNVSDVTLENSAVTIYQHETTTLTPTINPTNAEIQTVSWSSGDKSIATVDATGIVTGVAPGTAVITVTTDNGGKTATCDVTVLKHQITINDLLTKNNKPTLTGTTTAPNGSVVSILINEKTYTGIVNGGNWSVSVTDILPDKTYTATASILNTACDAALGTVTVDTVAPTITVATITTNINTPTIRGTSNAADGSRVTILINSTEYTGEVQNGIWNIDTTATIPDNTYTVSASVTDAAGNIGTATGTVTIDSVPRSSNNNLSNLTTSAGSVSPTFSSSVTEYTLNVASNVSSITVTPTAEYSKSIIRVEGVIVSSGSASGSISLNEGVNNLIVRVTAEDGTIKEYYLTVNRAFSVTDVTLDRNEISMFQFESTTLIPTINPTNAGDKSVTWHSSDESVATVDENGLVTGVAAGTAVITVTTNDGGKTATCNFTVSKPEVTVTIKDGNKLNINIHGWNGNYKYQIWTYQTVTSDLFLNASSNVKADQWVLSSQYASASTAVQESDGSISYIIDLPQNTPDGNYVISIKIQDENGNYIGELKDSYTPEIVGIAAISKVLVDGTATFSNETKEIKTGASVALKIEGINSDTYSVTMNGSVLFPASSNNTFTWDISDKQPGKYRLVFTAKNTTSGSTFNKTVEFTLYSKQSNINYGLINDMTAEGLYTANQFKVTLAPQIVNGDYFYYSIGEAGRTPIFTSSMLPTGASFEKIFNTNMYGIYTVYSYVKRAGSESYDDGFITTINNNNRGGGTIAMDVFADDVPINTATPVSLTKGTSVVIKGIATIGNLTQENIQYSFWRYDAQGYFLVKDWSSSNTLEWTPARVGSYTIQVRAKGADAGSYEILKSINVDVSTGEIAQGVDISINEAELNANATARQPIVINATATASNGDPLLYKFYVADKNMGTTMLQQYSPIQSCQWTPRKAGTYTISVLVKNSASFGKYDAVKSYTITVK